MDRVLIVVVIALVAGVGALAFAWLRSMAKLRAERNDHASFAKRFSTVTDMEAEARNVQQRLRAQKEELEAEIEGVKKRQQAERDRHQSIVAEEREKRTTLTNQYEGALQKYKQLRREIALLEENLEDVSFGLYQPHFSFDTAEDYKAALKNCRDRQRALIREGDAVGLLVIGLSREAEHRVERWSGSMPR